MIDIEIQKILDEKQKKVEKVLDCKKEISFLISQISNLDKKIISMIKPKRKPVKTPKKGIVFDIIGVMSKKIPLTKHEIFEKLKDKNIHIKENSLRCYLTSLDCFKNHKRKGWTYNEFEENKD